MSLSITTEFWTPLVSEIIIVLQISQSFSDYTFGGKVTILIPKFAMLTLSVHYEPLNSN